MDKKQDNLLYSNARGKPPTGVGRESGFDDETSTPKKGTAKRERDAVRILDMTQANSKKVATMVDSLTDIIHKHNKLEEEQSVHKHKGAVI